jgi:hypothetical protein
VAMATIDRASSFVSLGRLGIAILHGCHGRLLKSRVPYA